MVSIRVQIINICLYQFRACLYTKKNLGLMCSFFFACLFTIVENKNKTSCKKLIMEREGWRTTSSTTSIAGRLERRAEMPRSRQRARSFLASSCLSCGRFGSTPAPPCTAIAHPPIFLALVYSEARVFCVCNESSWSQYI